MATPYVNADGRKLPRKPPLAHVVQRMVFEAIVLDRLAIGPMPRRVECCPMVAELQAERTF